jgi:hypothetical protein
MSWVITGSEKNPVDLFRSQVSLLLHGDGTNGSTTIVDSSPSPKTVTAVGNAQISTAQSKPGFGGSSIAFDGNGDYLTAPYQPAFLLSSSNFTIEAWVYLNAYKPRNMAICGIWSDSSGSPQSWLFLITSLGEILILCDAPGGADQINGRSGSNVVPTSQWVHIAITRSGNTFRSFIGGVLSGQNDSAIEIQNGNGTVPLEIGGYSQAASESSSLNGYIDDLRITKGVARYTANFTPPTAPFPDI